MLRDKGQPTCRGNQRCNKPLRCNKCVLLNRERNLWPYCASIVTWCAWYYQSHSMLIPDQAVYPGYLLLRSLTQVGAHILVWRPLVHIGWPYCSKTEKILLYTQLVLTALHMQLSQSRNSIILSWTVYMNESSKRNPWSSYREACELLVSTNLRIVLARFDYGFTCAYTIDVNPKKKYAGGRNPSLQQKIAVPTAWAGW